MPAVGTEKPNKSVMGGKEKVRVAAIQAPQIVFNKDKSIDIACEKILEAGRNGAELVAFSETYIPVYPAYFTGGWESDMDEWMAWNMGLQDNSIVIPSDDTDRIGAACREAHVYCVMGVNEMDDAEGSRTLYNTQIVFGPDGSILGRHRKLMPTYTERTYWGNGDGSDLNVYKTPIGRIGSLICWEHHMLLVRVAQMLMGEEFHISNWPGTWKFAEKETENPANRHGKFWPENTNRLGLGCDLDFAIREYAFQSGSFVISVNGLLRPEDFEPDYKWLLDSDHLNIDWARGGSAIVNPFGEFLVEPTFNEDVILYADCYAKEIKAVKAVFDGLGHYARPDCVQLVMNKTHRRNLIVTGEGTSTASEDRLLRQISEQFEIDLDKLEKVAAHITDEQ